MRKFFAIISYSFILSFVLLFCSCGSKESSSDSIANSASVNNIPPTRTSSSIPQGERHNARIRINNVGRLWELFNDSNKYHYTYAERLGIAPINTLSDVLFARRPLVKIVSCDDYYVDSLSHSVPYLVPEAANLLSRIGRNFIDSLASRGGDGYRIKVTSLLRTPMQVKRLRRVNVNSSDSSTHQFGTTFDISWAKFIPTDSNRTINEGDLKNLLAEVLQDLRKDRRCLVKFERKTCCFHVTATK